MPVEVEEEEVTAEVREGPLKVMGTHVLYCDYGAGCTTVYTYQNSSNARFKRVDRSLTLILQSTYIQPWDISADGDMIISQQKQEITNSKVRNSVLTFTYLV